MDGYQRKNHLNSDGLGLASDLGGMGLGTGDLESMSLGTSGLTGTSFDLNQSIAIDPHPHDDHNMFSRSLPTGGVCPGRQWHSQLVGHTSLGYGVSTAPFPTHSFPQQTMQPALTTPAIFLPPDMGPGAFPATPGMTFSASAPSDIYSDPGPSNVNPNSYMLGSQPLAPINSSDSRGRPLMTNYQQPSEPSGPNRSRPRNTSRTSRTNNNNNTLQPPPRNSRRVSDPGRRPTLPINPNKRKHAAIEERIQCFHCEETFKMPADRDRHIKVKHIDITLESTVWVCRNKRNQYPKGYDRFIPLINCKACRDGKRYNASHNAEEHLRRKHFNPRIPGVKPQNEEERRGGKGGGKDPEAQYLKDHWIDRIDLCHKANCNCKKGRHEPLPRPAAGSRKGSRSQNVDVEMRDDVSESSYGHSSVGGDVSPNIANSQEYNGSANSMRMWGGQQSPMDIQGNFSFTSQSQPSSFPIAHSFPPPSPNLMMFGARPDLSNSQQNSGTLSNNTVRSPDETQPQYFHYDPDLDDHNLSFP